METVEPKTNNIQFKKISEYEIFGIVESENKFKIALGKNILTNKTFETEEEAINYIDSKPYELILNMIGFTISFTQGKL